MNFLKKHGDIVLGVLLALIMFGVAAMNGTCGGFTCR